MKTGLQTLPFELFHHLVHVLRLKKGDSFIAFDAHEGLQTYAKLGEVDKNGAEVILEEPKLANSLVAPFLLIQGLAKGDKNEKIVQDACELGASCIYLVQMDHSVAKIDFSEIDAKTIRYQKIVEQACCQSGRSHIPELRFFLSLYEAFTHLISQDIPFYPVVLWERAKTPFLDSLLAFQKAKKERASLILAMVVGPEGGLSESEIRLAQIHFGSHLCSLGPLILRTETAATSCLAAARMICLK